MKKRLDMLVDKWLTPTSRDPRTWGAVWLAVLAGITMAIGVIAVWYVINDRTREHIHSATDYATHINQLLIRQDIDNRLSALDRLAQRWTAFGGTPRPVLGSGRGALRDRHAWLPGHRMGGCHVAYSMDCAAGWERSRAGSGY